MLNSKYKEVSMIIELPKNYFYGPEKNGCAYVRDGILVVQGHINYEELMYNLAYVLKGYETCAFCGKNLEQRTRTLDHLYPRNWGGVSIPHNLMPACSRCNSLKGNLTYEQFMKFLELKVIKVNTKITKKGNINFTNLGNKIITQNC